MLLKDAPKVLDYLCEDCKNHHKAVCEGLDDLGIKYVVNPQIVRGLDYYTRTVFEFISNNIGAQGTVCGGGRYNNLVEQVGGSPCPAVGFGMGIERLMIMLANLELNLGYEKPIDVYIAPLSDDARKVAFRFANYLRGQGLSIEFDLMNRSTKAQMKYANKIGAKYVAIIGEDELKEESFTLKNMETGNSEKIKLVKEVLKEGN